MKDDNFGEARCLGIFRKNRFDSWASQTSGLVGKRKVRESLQQLEQLEARVALDADGGIQRGPLEVSQTVRLDGTDVGPSPFIFEKQAVVGDRIPSYVVTNVANGVVEKWDESTQAWLNISERPKSSNPRELLSLLQKRMFSEGDRLRWVPGSFEGCFTIPRRCKNNCME